MAANNHTPLIDNCGRLTVPAPPGLRAGALALRSPALAVWRDSAIL
jgi:hypothetical protein